MCVQLSIPFHRQALLLDIASRWSCLDHDRLTATASICAPHSARPLPRSPRYQFTFHSHQYQSTLAITGGESAETSVISVAARLDSILRLHFCLHLRTMPTMHATMIMALIMRSTM